MRSRMVVAAVVAALSLAAFAASDAYAGQLVNLRAGLELTEHGVPVPPGGTVIDENLMMTDECLEAANGKLLNNGDAVDLIQLGALWYDSCKDGGSLTGAIKYIGLSDTGAAVIYPEPAFTLTTPAGCVYKFGLLGGEFTIGDETVVYILGHATGALDARASSRSCPSTLQTEYSIGEKGTDGLLLNTELTSAPKF